MCLKEFRAKLKREENKIEKKETLEVKEVKN